MCHEDYLNVQSKYSNKWIISSCTKGMASSIPHFQGWLEWTPWKTLQLAWLLLGVLWPTACHTPNLLLCWDVPFHQRFALNSGHFDVRRNISELQSQVLPTDGHFGPTFTRPRHWVDLEKQAKTKENKETTYLKTSASSQVKEETISGLFVTSRAIHSYECWKTEGTNLLQIHY